MNVIIIAAVCASALSHGDHSTTAYKCDSVITGGTTTAQEAMPKPLAPEPVAMPAKKKPVVEPRCPAGKHTYHHRRGKRTWTTCK